MDQLSTLPSIIASIAYRDVVKYFKDRLRLLFSVIFPVVFIGILGGSLQANISEEAVGYNFLDFVLVGVLAQTLFQTVAQGVISLIDDRDKSLTQEFYVAPIPRWSIILGKIIGESVVAFVQGIFIIVFGLIIGVSFTLAQLIAIIPALLIIGLFGGAFGIFVTALAPDEQSANRLFPLVFFPQFFLAGVFSPIKELPWILLVASRIVPLTYAVDFMRSIYYAGTDAYENAVLFNPGFSVLIMTIYFVTFLILGTYLANRVEKNK